MVLVLDDLNDERVLGSSVAGLLTETVIDLVSLMTLWGRVEQGGAATSLLWGAVTSPLPFCRKFQQPSFYSPDYQAALLFSLLFILLLCIIMSFFIPIFY